jgi:hypothetical protein
LVGQLPMADGKEHVMRERERRGMRGMRRLARWACPAGGLQSPGAEVRNQWAAARGREHSQKRESWGFTLKATEGVISVWPV